jgi:RHS repeat-associated protein
LRLDHSAYLSKSATDRTGNGQYSQTYQHDAIGNMTGRISGTLTTSYWYSDTAHKHAVTGLSNGGAYQYDLNGNMTQRVELSGTQRYTYTQQWDVDNRLIAVTNTATLTVTRFYYDGDGQRVKKVESKGGTTITTAYAGAIEVTISGTQRITQAYYLAGAQRVAMRVITSTGSVVYYLHADHLGSASLTTDASGNKIGELRYMPYGETRYVWGATPTDRRYTGQRSEEASLGSLYDYGARFYSPSLGRFLSADTLVPSPGNPQSLNRYSYVLGNPLRFTDPTGHAAACGVMGQDCESDLPSIPQWTHPQNVSPELRQKAEVAYRHFLSDPSHFIMRYVDPAWDQYEEVGYLDVFVKNSELNKDYSSAAALVRGSVDPDLADALEGMLWNNIRNGFTPSAMGIVAAGATSQETCPTCGTLRPDIARSSGRLRIDADGASAWCANCVGSGQSLANPDPGQTYWVKSWAAYEAEALNTNVGAPEFNGPGDHVGVFKGGPADTSLSLWSRLNNFIKSEFKIRFGGGYKTK